MSTIISRIFGWLHGHVPTREHLEQSRWLRPFSKTILRSELWRFNRRSVPNGVALGVFVGLLFPFAHFIIAALLAVFVRANIPAAMAASFVGFPAFLLIIFIAAGKVGNWLLRIDANTLGQPISSTMQTTELDHLLQQITQKGPGVALGLLVDAAAMAAASYLVTVWVWRWWIGRKRRTRLANAAGRPPLP